MSQEDEPKYRIIGKYQASSEEIDTAKDLKEAEYLVGEYQMAYGKEWSVWHEPIND